MGIIHILYNKKAGESNSADNDKLIEMLLSDKTKMIDVAEIKDYKVFISGLEKEDVVVISGGDGTINRFINHVEGLKFDNEVLYFPSGTGNDFATDLGHKKNDAPFSIKEYLKDLPQVTVNGNKYRFINGVGFGIDGYCCEVGDALKEKSTKPVNYTAIAIKGLLFHYKPTNAKITVDGVTKEFKNVWLAPTMFGRYYGGGMMPTPNQTRKDTDKLSTMVFHGSGKIKTLMIFPSIFKGEHVKSTKHVEILEGKTITVEFDSPRALQIDGETILGVTAYTATASCISK